MRVSINMAMSMDGKIATKERGPVKLGSELDSRRMAEIRAEHDAVINGAATFRAHPEPLVVVGEDLLTARKAVGRRAQPISAVVSSRLEIPFGTPWEKAREIERWIFCGNFAPAEARKALEAAGVKVWQTKHARPAPLEIMTALKGAGVKDLLLEGGGEFNAAFLEKGLVDRIFLTMVPVLVGGAEAPTWCEGHGFAMGAFPRFRLAQVRNEAGELFLEYARA